MSFTLQFAGGPWHKRSEERRSAPDYIKVAEEDNVGTYSLDHVTGTTAHMIWKPTAKPQ